MRRRPALPKDPSQRAKALLDHAVGDVTRTEAKPLTEAKKFAQSGGLKGGRARADKLTPTRRREIAEKAAKARWGQKQK